MGHFSLMNRELDSGGSAAARRCEASWLQPHYVPGRGAGHGGEWIA